MNIDVYGKIMRILSNCDYDNAKKRKINDALELQKELDSIEQSHFKKKICYDIENENIYFDNMQLVQFENNSKIITYRKTDSYGTCDNLIIVSNNKAVIEIDSKSSYALLSSFLLPNVDEKTASQLLENIIIDDFNICVNEIDIYSSGSWYLNSLTYKKDDNAVLTDYILFYYPKNHEHDFSNKLIKIHTNSRWLKIIYKDNNPIFVSSYSDKGNLDNNLYAKKCVQIVNLELEPIYEQLRTVLPQKKLFSKEIKKVKIKLREKGNY